MKNYLHFIFILGFFTLSLLQVDAQTVFINEIHYDNVSTDSGEAIEVAGPAGTDLTGWSIVLYNGGNGTVYDTDLLSGTLTDQSNGYGFMTLSYPSNGIQNGYPDGLALVDASSNVIQFLSYEGTFTAVGGPADGMTSTDIGVSESGGGAVGNSLQLAGTGTVYTDFTWQEEAPNTFGAVNTGQIFSGTSGIPSQPTNLTALNTTQTTTDLSWDASTDDVAVVGYQIFDGATLIGTTTTETTFSVTGLTPATNYTFTVVAVDGDGNNSTPAEVSISTLSDVVEPLANVFINEIHYDNTSTDVGEEVEIAGLAGTDLTGWSIVLYNGNGGAPYNTTSLSGILPDMSDGYGFVTVSYPSNGIQNGAPDGIALVDASNNVIQFLSYEGSFTAVGGPADGMTSTDIGVSESGSGAVGNSLQLAGTGSEYSDFTWQVEAPNTFGAVNTDQFFISPIPNVFVNEIHYDNDGTDTGENIEVAGRAGMDLSGWSLVLYNGNGGVVYSTINLSGIIPNQDNGYGTLAFAAASMQNGAPDGLALVADDGTVIQFLSYEGIMTAVGGPADGMESEDIGVAEGGSTPVGFSLQLTGTGTKYTDFTWAAPMANTFGEVNTNQSFGSAPPPVDEPISILEARNSAEGSKVTISGILTVSDQFAGAAYMQDTTAGIAVYDAQIYGPGLFNIGDSITITGTLTIYNGLLEVSSLSSVVSHGMAVNPVEPLEITLAEMADHPSELVKVLDATFPSPNNLLFGNNNYTLSDASGSGEMRLDGDVIDLVGLSQPEVCEVTGVVGQYNDIYQLMPRMRSDLPCATEFTADDGLGISKDATLDIVTWNIEWFGDEGNSPAGANADMVQKDSVKAVLNSLDADIYAVEEVSDDALFAEMVSEMNGYDYVLSEYVSNPDQSGVKQKVGFIYKTSTVSLVETKPLLASIHPLYNGGDGSALVDYPDDDYTRFWASGRLPFMLVADVTINGATTRYNVIDIHARANSSSDALLRYEMRKYDVEVLKDSLDQYYSDANIVLVGDYNDDVDVTVADVPTTVTSYINYVDDPEDYSTVTGVLSAGGFRSYVFETDMIDHISITNELFENYIVGSARVHYEVYSSNYTSTTSDHFPVSARFQVKTLEITSVSVSGIDCNNGNNGTATVEVSGGIPPYSYMWSDGQTTATAENLSAGTYTVTVTDALNTQVSTQVELTDPDPIEIVLSDDQVVYPAYPDSACATLSAVDVYGGTGAFTYEWSTGETTESIVVCPLDETVYTLIVRDENNCEATTEVTVHTIDALCTKGNGMDKLEVCFHGKTLCVAYPAVDELLRNGATLGACSVEETPVVEVVLEDMVVYPNPFQNNFTVAFTSNTEAEALLVISSNGAVVYSEMISIHEGYNTLHLKMKNLASGFYSLSIAGSGGILVSEQIIKR
ncbi:MAG TPA: T9SS type A sorting domain-containing protein [Draconibacterium sp.]|nr:T9SS type A sorting domain-containing protein [Draconibacterium sp.]